MTFRKDSDIWLPYDKFEKIEGDETPDEIWTDEQIEEMLKRKDKVALQFVSNCGTISSRENFVMALMKHMNVTVLGKCSRYRCWNETCDRRALGRHFFYLAFENSVCQDYVTEKFWRIKELLVPVVLKRSVLKGIVDDQYFLAADDFSSPKELADRMIYLSQNIKEYKTYLGWTRYYKKTKERYVGGLCKICEILHKERNHVIPDIRKWWYDDLECEYKFALGLIPYKPNESQ